MGSYYPATKKEVLQAKYYITDLCRDEYTGRCNKGPAVDKVFYDIFGVKDVGYLLGKPRKSRRELDACVEIFDKCDRDRLTYMMLNPGTYEDFRYLISLCIDIAETKSKEKVADKVAVYNNAIKGIQHQYEIYNRFTPLINPVSYFKQRIRSWNEDRDYYYDRGYDDYYGYDSRDRYDDRRKDDYYGYDDYGYDDRRSRDRFDGRRDFSEDDYFGSIIEGTDPDIVKRRGGKRDRDRYDDSSLKYRDYDDERDYDREDRDADDRFKTATAETFKDVADQLGQIRGELSELKRSYPEARRDEEDIDEKEALYSSIRDIRQNMQILMDNQVSMRADIDGVIDAYNKDADDDSPGDTPEPSGDLMKTTGGVKK